MLHMCHQYYAEWDLVLNVKKSSFMVICEDDELLLPNMTLGSGILSWVKEIKYLGVFLKSKKGFRVKCRVQLYKNFRCVICSVTEVWMHIRTCIM